jgi:tetratricopeptide (TPR) repeat protein
VVALGMAGATAWLGWRWFESRPLREAEGAYRRSDWAAAYAVAESYRRAHPTSREATLVMMRSLAQVGRCEAALNLSGQVVDVEPDDLRLIASCLVAQGVRSGSSQALEAAAELYRRILEMKPADGDGLKQRAALLVQLDRPIEAVEEALKLAEIPAHARSAHAIMGTIHYGRGDYTQASDHLLKVLELDPELKLGPESPQSILGMLARGLIQLGRGAEAETYLLRLPDAQQNPQTLWQLGHSRQQQADADGAIAYWQAATRLDQDYLPALRDIADLELARDRPDAALEPLERVLKLAPQDATIHYRLGLALRRIGREEDAAQHFREAERLIENQ